MLGKSRICIALFSVVFFISSPSAFADDRVLEEIIVTGTKRAVSQQDTPIAISTLTAEAIAQTRGNDIRAVGDLSPNVNLTLQTGFNALAGGIRGTGTISILTTQDPSVGILIDDFALNHVQTQFVELKKFSAPSYSDPPAIALPVSLKVAELLRFKCHPLSVIFV